MLIGRCRSLLRVLASLEWVVVGAAVPLLTFPTVRPRWSAAALALLAALWLFRWMVRGEPWPVSPLNAALLPFLLVIPFAILVSAFPEVTGPAAVRLVLGLAAFRAAAFFVRNERTLDVALVAFCLLGLGLAVVGVLAVQWPRKSTVLGEITGRIPRLIETFPEDQGTRGVNPNHLAGAILLYLPLGMGLMVRAWRRSPALVRFLMVPAAAVFTLVIGLVLVLTQSRSGWIGAGGGLLALVILAGVTARRLWARAVGVGLAVVVVVTLLTAVATIGLQEIGEMVTDPGAELGFEDAVGSITLAGRIELWSRAVYAAEDFAFAGCGLSAFSRVVQILYPLFHHGPGTDVGHAHNVFLQMAVDVGIPGLIGYLALVGVALALCWRCARQRRNGGSGAGTIRPVALGLAAGLIAWHVYGLTDAVALGTKPGVVLWIALGLVAALDLREEWLTDGATTRR